MVYFKKFFLFLKVVIAGLYTGIMSLIAGIFLFFPYPHRSYLFFGRIWSKGILKLFGITVTVTGKEKISNKKGLVYLSNHASLFDIFILMAHLPGQIRFLGKKELCRVPVFGWVWKFSGNIPIDRKSTKAFLGSLERAGESVKRGNCIIIYPEGTRTRDGKIHEFKRGLFPIAKAAKAPLVPVTIKGSFGIRKRGVFAVNPENIKLTIHDPVQPDYSKMDKQAQLALLSDIRSTIQSVYND